jgi:pimeloyl-ACP methyl ester carboxylesterase
MGMATIENATVSRLAGPAGSLHVDDGGRGGVPVVFLHSFAGSTRHWAKQLDHLREDRRALAIDLRGHGESDAPSDGNYTADALAQDVAAIVDTLGLKRFVLVGHSMGGSAAIAYAAAHPDRVAGLVLAGTPGRTPPEQAQKTIAAIEGNYDQVMKGYWDKLLTNAKPEVHEEVAGEALRMRKEEALAIIKGLFQYDPLPAFGRFRVPTMIVSPEQGESAADLHQQLPELPYRTIAGTSHWMHLDKPDEFNRLLDDFLTRIQP